jgi:hypothetical protein
MHLYSEWTIVEVTWRLESCQRRSSYLQGFAWLLFENSRVLGRPRKTLAICCGKIQWTIFGPIFVSVLKGAFGHAENPRWVIHVLERVSSLQWLIFVKLLSIRVLKLITRQFVKLHVQNWSPSVLLEVFNRKFHLTLTFFESRVTVFIQNSRLSISCLLCEICSWNIITILKWAWSEPDDSVESCLVMRLVQRSRYMDTLRWPMRF